MRDETPTCEKCEGELTTELPLYSKTAGPLCELCYLREENSRVAQELRWAEESQDCLRKELDGKTKELTTEREGLVSWLHSRIAQQQQVFKMGHISNDSKRLIEIEIGFVERYLGNILEAKHRNNNPAVSVPENTPFKPLRDMERDALLVLIQKDLVEIQKHLKAAKPRGNDHQELKGAEEALVTLMDQIHAGEYR